MDVVIERLWSSMLRYRGGSAEINKINDLNKFKLYKNFTLIPKKRQKGVIISLKHLIVQNEDLNLIRKPLNS